MLGNNQSPNHEIWEVCIIEIDSGEYRISSNKRPRRLYNLEALRCGAYWRAMREALISK